jgi:hypothetical protein
VYAAREYLTENFCVINSDDFYGRDAFMKVAEHLRAQEQGNHYCMVGYHLGNTLTDSGTVSRGECRVDNNGMLQSVTERTDIRKQATNAAYCDEQGNWVDLSFDTVVSMNFWGMTPSFLDLIGRGFETFLAERGTELKSEYYIPGAVDDFMKAGLCDVRVYDTDARWYGVTYAEDKPQVKASIRKMIEDGQYPEKLWD